jgi:hypothetical protein
MKWVYTPLNFMFILTLTGVGGSAAYGQGFDVCQLYGVVYVTDNPHEANFKVYIEDSEAFADLAVFREENRLMADEPGIWFITDTRAFANFAVYFERNRGQADFAIFFTDILSFAGCKN